MRTDEIRTWNEVKKGVRGKRENRDAKRWKEKEKRGASSTPILIIS